MPDVIALPLLGWRVVAVAISLGSSAIFGIIFWVISTNSEGHLLGTKLQTLVPFL